MYRKKLMRVALAGIMTATVITSSVPVNAAEPVAAKQEETTTKISNTKKAEYQKKEVGVVDCETTVKGTANGEAFEKKYTMQMVVKRDENDVVTVYEINSITWE